MIYVLNCTYFENMKQISMRNGQIEKIYDEKNKN